MSYPKIILTRRVRRLIMAAYILAFFLITPTLILYSAGYRYDWETGRIKQTGVISIDVKPRDARVFLNNIEIKKRLPLELTNRAPGTYHLRIEKSGFKPWEKDITVTSKQTTYLKEITLWRESLPSILVTEESKKILDLYPSPDGRYLLLVIAEFDTIGIELFDTQTQAQTLLTRAPRQTDMIVQWSPFDNSALVAKRLNSGWSVTLFDAHNPDQKRTYMLVDQTPLPSRLQWAAAAASVTVFVNDHEKLLRLNLNGEKRLGGLAPADIWYVDSNDRVWLVKDNSLLPLMAKNSTASARLLPANINRIIDMNDKRLIAQSNQEVLIVPFDQVENKATAIKAASLAYNQATNEWLAWSPFELWTIYENGDSTLLNRSSEQIKTPYPLEETSTLLLLTNKGLTAFNPGYNVAQILFPSAVINAGVNRKTRSIYFLGRMGERKGLFVLEY